MKENRRKFIRDLSALGLGINISSSQQLVKVISEANKPKWKKIINCFPASKNKILNFNNGSCGVMPNEVIDKYVNAVNQLNQHAPYQVQEMWQEKFKKTLNRLAHLLKLENGHLSLVRNTTEAINLVLWGIDFKPNDKVVFANWDYPFVEYSLINIKNQKGIELDRIKRPLNTLTEEDILDIYEKKLSKSPKLLIVTWITHGLGQILPIQKICQIAKHHNVPVLIDAAHVTGHIPSELATIHYNYLATSLHKWLNAPQGTGLLFVKNENVSSLKPPISYSPKVEDKNVKFSYLGTRAFQNIIGVAAALDFLELTGVEKKSSRLRALNQHWIDAFIDDKKIVFESDTSKTCGVVTFSVVDKSPSFVKKELLSKFNIHIKTTGISNKKKSALRVSPNIYHDFKDIDKFIQAVHHIINS